MATSTAEAELYAGNAPPLDGSSGVCQRRGADSAVHRLQCGTVHDKREHGWVERITSRSSKNLWLQEAVRSGKLTVEKVPTETNSSHLGTKHLTSERSEMLLRLVNCFCV